MQQSILSLFPVILLLTSCSSLWDGHGSETPLEVVRSFEIQYQAVIENLPVGKTVQVWIPVPHDDPHQKIRNLQISGNFSGEIELHTESVYGNRMAYYEGTVLAPSITFTIEYQVDRYLYQTNFEAIDDSGEVAGTDFDIYLKPSALCFVNDTIRLGVKEIVANRTTTLEKARGFYDHVLTRMSYDKNHQGWGRGSTEHACSVGKGNCTDFHTYFNSLCLAAGIHSRFQIGVWGRYETVSGTRYKTGDYHCWAEFYVPGHGWVTVDISEADRNPSKVDAYFGYHTANRVTVSTGRDIVLEPPQAGEPLNYFINPYSEVDGRSHPLKKASFWRDLNGS